jgi:hypothetical protein
MPEDKRSARRPARRPARPSARPAAAPAADQHTKNHRLQKSIAWVATVGLAAVIGVWATQGSHSLTAQGLCAARYVTAPATSHPPTGNWAAYGVTQLTAADRSLTIKPSRLLATDEWFGASLNGPRLCDYRVDFDAELSTPLFPQLAGGLGYGYAVGAGGEVTNDVPGGTTVQFDPPFGGLRTVELPAGVNVPGQNAQRDSFVRPGRYCHWELDVRGSNMTVFVNGRRYGIVQLMKNQPAAIILRVWDADLTIRNVRIARLGI